MRSLACRADVSLNQVGLLYGNIEVFLVGELDLDIITLTDAVYFLKDSYSVVHMNHIVAFMKLDKAVQGRCLRVLKSLYYLLLSSEDFVFAEDDELLASDRKTSGHLAHYVLNILKVAEHCLKTLLLNFSGDADVDLPSVAAKTLQILFEECEIAKIRPGSVYLEAIGVGILAQDIQNRHRSV